MRLSISNETEPVGADDCAGMNDRPISNRDVLINHDSWMENAVVADCCVLSDVASGFNHS